MTAQEKVSLALLDQLASCVLLLDESREIVILNTAAETLLEASAARLGGSDIAQVIDLDDTLDSLLSQALENNYPVVKRELDILLRGGQRFCVDFVVSPLSLEQAQHLLLEFNPVDRLNAISEDEHMWQAQASLRQIIRGLAHEVKNPLGGIRGAAQLLARELESPTLREYTDVIMEEFLYQGKSMADARAGGPSGCVTVSAFGKESCTLTGYCNWPKVFELACNDGIDPRTDTVRLYGICERCRQRIRWFGTAVVLEVEPTDIIV